MLDEPLAGVDRREPGTNSPTTLAAWSPRRPRSSLVAPRARPAGTARHPGRVARPTAGWCPTAARRDRAELRHARRHRSARRRARAARTRADGDVAAMELLHYGFMQRALLGRAARRPHRPRRRGVPRAAPAHAIGDGLGHVAWPASPSGSCSTAAGRLALAAAIVGAVVAIELLRGSRAAPRRGRPRAAVLRRHRRRCGAGQPTPVGVAQPEPVPVRCHHHDVDRRPGRVRGPQRRGGRPRRGARPGALQRSATTRSTPGPRACRWWASTCCSRSSPVRWWCRCGSSACC